MAPSWGCAGIATVATVALLGVLNYEKPKDLTLIEEVEGVGEVLWEMGHRALQGKENKTEERPLISSFVGCYDGAAWSMKMAEGVQNGKDGFVLKKVPQARSGSIVDGCAAGCHALKYKRFGIFDTDKCICASGDMNQKKETLPNGHQNGCKPCTSLKDFMKWNNTYYLKYTCGAKNRTSVYRADYRNHEWEVPVNQVYPAPSPPTITGINSKKYELTKTEIKHLMALLDRDNDGKIQQEELIDVFDHFDNNALTVKDCSGNKFPSRWLGDGFCDKGGESEDCLDGKCPNFNCGSFHCDNGDCSKESCLKTTTGRDRVTTEVNGLSDGSFGKIVSMGSKWKSQFWATAGETYYFATIDGGTLNQSTGHGLGVTLFDKSGKQMPKGKFVVGLGENHGVWIAPGKFAKGLGPNAGQNISVKMEVRVADADGVCIGGKIRGVSGPAICYTLVTGGNYTYAEALSGCKKKTGGKGTLTSIARSDEERFVVSLWKNRAAEGSVWVGGSRPGKGKGFAWADGAKWKFTSFAQGEPKEDCVAVTHVEPDKDKGIKGSDKWSGKKCSTAQAGYICKHDTNLTIEATTGSFQLYLVTAAGLTAKPKDPHVWKTALYHRHGPNLTAHGFDKFHPKNDQRLPRCKNRLDLQQNNNSYCDNMVKEGFSCTKYFCEDEKKCDYAGYCDKTCTYGTCVSRDKRKPPPPGPPPRSELVNRNEDVNNACAKGKCYDKYDCQGSRSKAQTKTNAQSKNSTKEVAGKGQCELLIEAGFSCKEYLCPVCSYGGYCDKTCKFGKACNKKKRNSTQG